MKKKRRKLKKDRKKSWQIFQGHHVSYPCCEKPVMGPLEMCENCKKTFSPEIVFRITRTEHFFCGRLERYFKYRGMTPGMEKTLKYYCKKYRGYKSDQNGTDTTGIKEQGVQDKVSIGNQGRPEA